ncbi:nucleolin 2-like [Senna tora]|uniref:Nucleolin 2-like n=1 Tax=Senna tora TaxID=362788 RepID=A0A834SRJ2_9FABA|nr:nucleolin 2-like [Senna tora]
MAMVRALQSWRVLQTQDRTCADRPSSSGLLVWCRIYLCLELNTQSLKSFPLGLGNLSSVNLVGNEYPLPKMRRPAKFGAVPMPFTLFWLELVMVKPTTINSIEYLIKPTSGEPFCGYHDTLMNLDIGKREADNELEQQVSAKKQKRDEVTENQKNKANVQNKKESSSDGSFSDSEEDEKLAAKTPVATSETLSTQAQKSAGSPCSSGSSDDDSGVNDDLKTKITTSPKLPAAGKNESSKKVESNEASDSDSDRRTAEDNVATSSKKLLAASAAVNIIPAKKVEPSDVSSLDSGLDEDNVQKMHLTPSSEKLPASVVAQKEKNDHKDNSYVESSSNVNNVSVGFVEEPI